MRKNILIVSLVMGSLGCGHTPRVHEKAQEEYSKNIKTFSLSESKSWQTKSCPKDISKWEKKPDWKELIQFTNGCVSEGKWNHVEELANMLARQDHLAPWGSYYLSVAAEARKDHPRALWMIELAQKKAPQVGLLEYQKGRILWNMEDYTAAVNSFEKALDKDPSLFDAHLMLGQVYYRDQEFDKARKHFTAVLKTEPHHSVGLAGLAECELHKNNPALAQELLEKAIRKNSKDLSLRLRLAYVYESLLKDLPKAVSSYKEIRKLLDRKQLIGIVEFDLSEKIRTLESSIDKLALQGNATRKPSSEEKVAK